MYHFTTTMDTRGTRRFNKTITAATMTKTIANNDRRLYNNSNSNNDKPFWRHTSYPPIESRRTARDVNNVVLS